jgi:hypothetical protein
MIYELLGGGFPARAGSLALAAHYTPAKPQIHPLSQQLNRDINNSLA